MEYKNFSVVIMLSARKHSLKVWFRGNLSGWEEWFGYPSINRDEHTAGIVRFITNNPDLFEDGDIFVTCNECENGERKHHSFESPGLQDLRQKR